MVRVAVVLPQSTGLSPVQLLLGQPATFPLTVVAGAMGPMGPRSNVPRPLWSAERLTGALPWVTAGTGFAPGATLPPPFWHVYAAFPARTILATAGWLPKPLPSPFAENVS